MNIKKFISLVLAALFIFLSTVPAFAKSNDAKNFKGGRNIVFSVDASDLDNFVNGGRSAFELSVRKNKPEWLDLKINTVGRDVQISFFFEFESFSDYLDKISALLTFEPAIVYETESGLTFIEGFSTSSLVNFIVFNSKTSNIADEFSPSEFFKVEANNITINKTLYEQKDNVCITTADTDPIKLDRLEISTSFNEDKNYSRKIYAFIIKEGTKSSDIKAITQRFKSVGETVKNENDSNYTITVDFTASGQNELILKTIKCLYVSTNISESQVFIEGNKVGVIRSEEIGWNILRRSEESSISNKFVFPEHYTSFKSLNLSTSVGSHDIYYEENKGICYYEREFMFNSITVTSDFSSVLPKVEKTITFTAPTYIAVNFHEKIMQTLSARLEKGCVFNIYDFAGMRYYEIVFSSWFGKELSKTTSLIMGSKYSCEHSRNLIPFAYNTYREKGTIKSFINDNSIANNIIFVYTFSDASDISKHNSFESFSLKTQNTLLVYADNGKISVNFEYREFSLLKLLLVLTVVAVVAFFIVFVSKKAKKNKNEITNKKPLAPPKQTGPIPKTIIPPNTGIENNSPVNVTEESFDFLLEPFFAELENQSIEETPTPSNESQTIVCPACGTPAKNNASFCKKCGAKLK